MPRLKRILMRTFTAGVFNYRLRLPVWTMPATTLTTVTATQVKAGGEDDDGSLTIKIFAFDKRIFHLRYFLRRLSEVERRAHACGASRCAKAAFIIFAVEQILHLAEEA